MQKNNKVPKVSILLPTHNGAKWVRSAIESVLVQDYSEFELIVIDDASTDNVAAVVRDLAKNDSRVHYIKNEVNLGIQKTLNKGIALARGKYIARIDDDDMWSDIHKLGAQVEFLETHPDYMLVGTGTVIVNEEGNELFRFLAPETDNDIRKILLFRNCFTHSSVMFRSDIVRALRGYREDEETRHIEDYELWLRMGTKGKLHNLPLFSVRFMMRRGAISARYKPVQLYHALRIISRYRVYYRFYPLAWLFALVRYVGYRIFLFFPGFIQQLIVRIYKQGC
ncbi:MAG: glycosyltransferase family 2 protein [Patescibacteria group bacterium]|nr:glycosyltransferase family 2 protein [Patescibacteria group bacterium]MDE2438253.1 glycosyltransferase family 2 protein [Patescibacteria group bacterium]